MKAIGYVRVSTQGQAEEGVSLEAQESKITAWAELNGYEQVEVYLDAGVSGSRADNREGLQSALSAVGKGDALVVYSLSRLARSTKDTLNIADHLIRRDADLVSLSERLDTTSAAGKMVFRMLAVLAEFERDQIAERTKTAMAHLKAKRVRVGAIPYGYRLASDGCKLEAVPQEQQVIRTARSLKRSGLSLRQIATALTAEGFAARSGRCFAPMQVKRLIDAA